MKKIININLSGVLIPIEDSAYEILRNYIESLRRYFSNEEGMEEIIGDIESRITELFQEKLKKGAHCITDADVEQVMHSIGRPEDFGPQEEDAAFQAATNAEQEENSGEKGRLYRNSSDRILGGVCSGVANSLKIDPSIVRVLFALVTLGGFGFGILLYIILWLVLPERPMETNSRKRLFRNPDNKVIGGVASGLAAFFNIEVWIPRIIFLSPLILSVLSWISPSFFNVISGSLSGVSMLTYLILWMVLPEASNASEKLQMKGQKVDLQNIKNTVKEEMKNFKGRAEKFGNEFKDSARDLGTNFTKEVTASTKPIAQRGGHIIGVIFKAFFLFIGGIIAFALFLALVGLFVAGSSVLPFSNYLVDNTWGTVLLFLGALLIIVIPIIAIIIWFIRRIMGVKSGNRYLGYTFSVLWFAGVVCTGIIIYNAPKYVRIKANIEKNLPLVPPSNDKLIIKVSDQFNKVKIYGSWFHSDWIQTSEDSLFLRNIRFRIVKSVDSSFHLDMLKASNGRTGEEARMLADNIKYDANQQDSVLYLDNGFPLYKGEKFRGQRVLVTLQVPLGKHIIVDRSVNSKFGWISFGERWDEEDEYRNEKWRSGIEYIMTIGGLERVSPLSVDELDASDRKALRRRALEEKRNAKDEERRIKKEEIKAIEEQEENLKEQLRILEETKKSHSGNIEETPGITETVKIPVKSTMVLSPVLSLINRLR